MSRPYAVQRVTGGYVVVNAAGEPVCGVQASRDRAEEICETRLQRERRRTQARTRPCLCCQRSFASEGIHNRLCPGCRNADLPGAFTGAGTAPGAPRPWRANT